jgi:glycosyltransferase involved in cell wall biosynthesis
VFTYSVIITTHHRATLLPRAIRSVKQQAADVRIILVSDIACAETYAVATAMLGGNDIFVERRGAPGPAESRNTGIRLLATDFALFLDDDDALSPQYLSEIERHVSKADVLYTDFFWVLEQIQDNVPVALSGERHSLAQRSLNDIYVKNFIPPACLVYPTDALRNRSVDPSLVLNEDWDFALNVLADYPFRHAPVDGPIVYTRQQADNRGRTNDHRLVDTYRTIYRNRPAPTAALKAERQAFFARLNINASLEDL